MRQGHGSRLALLAPLVAFAATIVALATAGSHRASPAKPAGTRAAASHRGNRAPAHIPRRFVAVPIGALPAAVQDSAVAPAGAGRLALLGGLDSAQNSTAGITLLDGGAAVGGGTLPSPQHDAQAARLESSVYVFGGGALSSYDHILRYDLATRQVSSAGVLPSPASDVAVAVLGQTAYVVGGYDGVHPLDTILAWRPGAPARVVAHLPTGLRYAAVGAAGGKLIVAGGTAGEGQALTDAIFRFDPATGSLTRIGRLPFALTHASAASLDGEVLIVGGRRALSGAQSDTILAVDPTTGRVRSAGRLPAPLSDAAVSTSAGRIIVAGGESPAGAERAIIALNPAQ